MIIIFKKLRKVAFCFCLLMLVFSYTQALNTALFSMPVNKEENVFQCLNQFQNPLDTPIIVHGDEQERLNLQLPDGGLKPLPGVHNIQILRTCRSEPGTADQDGWTYAHHMDLACWKGRLYAAWAMTPIDEDVQPYKVVFATSQDGVTWTAPADLFPREIAWPLRFYFYIARNGRMLAFSAGKTRDDDVSESFKDAVLVREITRDHQLGEVFTFINPLQSLPAIFETSNDTGFVEACREAAANNLLLEQQDYGMLLGNRRMPWHEDPPKYNGSYPFGKALCFYHRKDGKIVGLSKMGFTTVSVDQGKTWSMPVLPPTLFAGSGKIWGQRTNDGSYALVYNPDPAREKRYPLVLVQGKDGREFSDMRVIHGEFHDLRYPGRYKNGGAQYVRGLAEWSDDGTFSDKQSIWLIYSVNKEDIWLARVPLPLKSNETVFPSENFQSVKPGGIVPGWNIYSPRWAPVCVVEKGDNHFMELRDADPYDYARAIRLFPETAKVRVEFEVMAENTDSHLEVEIYDAMGSRPVCLIMHENQEYIAITGSVSVNGKSVAVKIGNWEQGNWNKIILTADVTTNKYSVKVNGGETKVFALTGRNIESFGGISFRTGSWRGVGYGAGVEALSDIPAKNPIVIHVDNVVISSMEVAVDEIKQTKNISIYPNPAKDMLQITSDKSLKNVSIYNVSGKRVMDVTFENMRERSLNISSLEKGLYLIKVSNAENEVYTTKFVIQ